MKIILTVLALVASSICAEVKSQSMQDMYRRQEAITSRCDQKFRAELGMVESYICVNGNTVVQHETIQGQLGVEKITGNAKTMYQIEGEDLVMYICIHSCENVQRWRVGTRIVSEDDAANKKKPQMTPEEKFQDMIRRAQE